MMIQEVNTVMMDTMTTVTIMEDKEIMEAMGAKDLTANKL